MLFKGDLHTQTGKKGFISVVRIVAALTIFVFCVSGLPFAPGVIMQMNFNEGIGTTAADQSGNGHSGTLVNGPTWTAGKFGQAINFDGANDYLNIPDHSDFTLNPAQSYTWSVWVKNTNFNQWGTVWSQTLDANNYFYFYAHSVTAADAGPVTNGISVYWNTGTSKVVLHSTNNVLSVGTWTYITITYDGSLAQASRFTIYANAVDVTDRTDVESTGTIGTINPTNIRMASNEPFGDFLTAAIDEPRYYTRLLSASEINTDMNSPIDNTAPSVSVSNPSNGVSVSGTISVNANASDNVGVVGVQFLLDGVNLGSEDLVAPYSVSWNTVATSDGAHSLTARARDLAGNIATSSSVSVTIANDLVPPSISLTSPGAGLVNGTISVSANASDNIGVVGVQFLLNGANLGPEIISAPYTYSWNTTVVSDGPYVITARARDAAGNTTTTTAINITVHNIPDTQAPAVNLTAPASGILNGIINITANATDNVAVAGVQFLLNGANLGAEDLTAPYSLQWNSTSVPDGHYTLAARARDLDGNTTTTTAINITVYNNPDTESPTVLLTSPPASTIAGTVNVNATANDNISVAGVQFLLNGVSLGAEDITAPYSYLWNTAGIPDGNYLLTARARDLAGNIATTSPVMVTVKNDSIPPTVALTSPAAGTVGGTITVSANATDNVNVAGVQFLLNGSNLGVEDITAPYSISWNTRTISNGTYTLTAKARDASGNIQISAPVVVTVSNLPPDTEYPSVSITSPSAGNVNGLVNITANATDNVGVVGVQFFLNGSNLGTELMSAPYSLSWNSYSVSNGNYTLTAIARDAAGNMTTSVAVNINVNNAADSQVPTVVITAPAAGNVIGTINVKANASDNIGIAGVQFFLDGTNLGTEDLAAPYSIVWNTALATAGAHLLSARARDLAGNYSITAFLNVNVIVPSPPSISSASVNTITAGTAIITWTTNVPSTSQVNYDASANYSLFTLTDSTPVTSHSMLVTGLAPSTLYHYQVVSSDSNGAGFSSDNTFTTASLASSPGSLNQHTVLAYPSNKIIPWTTNPSNGYDTVMYLAWNYLLTNVPNDPSTGKLAYYSRSYIDPATGTVVDWPHNPAGLFGMLTESALKYYPYSANSNVVQLVTNVANWHLDHGMTLSNDSWPSVPYSSGDAGSTTYGGASIGNTNGQGDGVGYLEPDKIGELANAWLQLYKYGGNTRFRDAAIQAANVLSSKIRTGNLTQSPWPFRVNAHTGAVREDYCSNIIPPISLLDNLIAAGFGDTAAYRVARNAAWNWLMTYPMVNNVWAQYFEDVPVQSDYNDNLNQYNAMMVARYLLEHPEFDANWETHARGLITWVENTFGQANFGATTIREQQQFFHAMGSHTSRYASVNALLFEKTGDLTAKEKAYRAFNWASYMCRTNGVVIDGPEVNNQWFTDGYGDYVRHFMTGIAASPDWSPSNQTHLLRSSSVVKSINYGINNVSYTTYDSNATEVLHLNFNPVTVMSDSVVLSHRSDLNQPGWTLDIGTKTLRIYHNKGTRITISSGGPLSLCPGETVFFSLPKPGIGYSYQWQVDSTGAGFIDLQNNSVHSGTNTDTLWINEAPTSYAGYQYRCIATKTGTPVTGPSYQLKFVVKWQGAATDQWEEPSNWSCNYVPDAKTEVIIVSGTSNAPVIHSNTSVHSIILSAGSNLTIAPNVRLDIKGK